MKNYKQRWLAVSLVVLDMTGSLTAAVAKYTNFFKIVNADQTSVKDSFAQFSYKLVVNHPLRVCVYPVSDEEIIFIDKDKDDVYAYNLKTKAYTWLKQIKGRQGYIGSVKVSPSKRYLTWTKQIYPESYYDDLEDKNTECIAGIAMSKRDGDGTGNFNKMSHKINYALNEHSLITLNKNGLLCFWNLPLRKESQPFFKETFELLDSKPYCMKVSAKNLVAVSNAKKIMMWQMDEAGGVKFCNEIDNSDYGSVVNLAFSSSGAQLAIASPKYITIYKSSLAGFQELPDMLLKHTPFPLVIASLIREYCWENGPLEVLSHKICYCSHGSYDDSGKAIQFVAENYIQIISGGSLLTYDLSTGNQIDTSRINLRYSESGSASAYFRKNNFLIMKNNRMGGFDELWVYTLKNVAGQSIDK